jgi:YD repeat-containing protein
MTRRGRPRSDLPGLGHAPPRTTYLYDAASNLLSFANPRNVVTSFAYDALNRERARIDAQNDASVRRTAYGQKTGTAGKALGNRRLPMLASWNLGGS